LVNLDPTIGSEMKKNRPCLIISPNEMIKYLQTIVIAPMTSSSKNYPTRVSINYDKKTAWIVLDQIRSVDKKRLKKRIGKIDTHTAEMVKLVLQTMFS
jgi:mRNA interferase MazF